MNVTSFYSSLQYMVCNTCTEELFTSIKIKNFNQAFESGATSVYAVVNMIEHRWMIIQLYLNLMLKLNYEIWTGMACWKSYLYYVIVLYAWCFFIPNNYVQNYAGQDNRHMPAPHDIYNQVLNSFYKNINISKQSIKLPKADIAIIIINMHAWYAR